MISDKKLRRKPGAAWLIAAATALLLSGCAKNGGQETELPSPPLETASPAPPVGETPQTDEEELETEPDDSDLVRILDYIPGLYVDLKYATEENFTGTAIYEFTDARLRYGTVKKLKAAQAELEKQGYSLKIWDAYRPVSAQLTLWEICPDPAYVSDPNTGYSSHCRGNTVDMTLVMADGSEVEMPTGFDDFSPLADRDYSDIPEPAKSNALLLEALLFSHGFLGYAGEWWHYSDSEGYPVIED